jgi:AcrR family transcriptional regulator
MNEVPPGTKDRLLDTAERLFAESGIDAISLRAITAEAGVNLAAVNYHFQSKDALVIAVIERRFGPINRERLRMLDEFETAAQGGRVSVALLVKAFLLPVVELRNRQGRNFVPLMARIYTEQRSFFERIFRDHVLPVVHRFHAAFQRALPHLPPEEVMWRIQFLAGAMVHTVGAPIKIAEVARGICDPTDTSRLMPMMITFFTAAFEAPATEIPDATV